MPRVLPALLVLLAGLDACAVAPSPFVGCPTIGQTGLIEAPARPRNIPFMAEARLTYYASDDLAVMAPTGWHCLGLYGSNGSILLVTPRPPDRATLLDGGEVAGPAVEAVISFGDTSGRFDVARIAARLFPDRTAFVQSVIREGIEPVSAFPSGPYPADTLRRTGPDEVAFITADGQPGIGTTGRLVMDGGAVRGLVRMTVSGDLETLRARLPPDLNDLQATIIAKARRLGVVRDKS